MKILLLAASVCLFSPVAASAADLAFLKGLVEMPGSPIDCPRVNGATEWADVGSIDAAARHLAASQLAEYSK